MILKNGWYDKLKWIVITGSPALIALISGLGALYGFDTKLITGTIGLVTAFIGALIGVGSIKYQRQQKELNEPNDENGN